MNLVFSIEMLLLLASIGFIACLKLLGKPSTARLGNGVGSVAMLLAVVSLFILLRPRAELPALLGAIVLGSLVGVYSARKVKMTQMPQLVALFNGVGGAASVLVAACELLRINSIYLPSAFSPIVLSSSWFSGLVGAITFTGSLCAFGKLEEWLPARALSFRGQKIVSCLIFCLLLISLFVLFSSSFINEVFWTIVLISSIFGVLLVLPIGGADMPVVISLLNSYSGLAAMSAGFVVDNKLLIIAGALVGASGFILTRQMCLAMNRSLAKVIFGAFTQNVQSLGNDEEKIIREFTPLDAALLLNNANRVVVIPGYGLAVSQAQHSIRDLALALKNKGVQISYAVHPVAGRMPGHMNVLLAEADISYEDLCDLEEANGRFENTDVAIVVGANDVVNPLARSDKQSPLYGMPILDADRAKSIIVLKRGKGTGFAGVENPLFSLAQTALVYGDAKKSLSAILTELKKL